MKPDPLPDGRRAPFQVGLIGLGAISHFYIEAVEQLTDIALVAVCDEDPSRLDPIQASVFGTTDYRELLALLALDGVIIALPNDLHFEVCKASLEAGLHVCVEKPLTIKRGHAGTLNDIASSVEKTLFTAFHRRYNKNVADLERRSDPRDIRSIRVRYSERIEEHSGGDSWYLDPARCGGGCVADNGPNAFDLVRRFIGPCRVKEARLCYQDGVDVRALIELEAVAGKSAHIELDWAYTSGELKDISVRFADGREAYCDMLSGFPGFKASLSHEYIGVLRDFLRQISLGRFRSVEGEEAICLVEETYRNALPLSPSSTATAKSQSSRPVRARAVRLLDEVRDDRGMTLINHETRCVVRGEIHELVTTDTLDPAAEARVDRVGFVAFIEIEEGGVIAKGDNLHVAGRFVGRVIGFDDCHFPNHYNILVESSHRLTASMLGVRVETIVEFSPD